MTESKAEAVYIHGHVASVLRSHTSRTASNSAAFLLPHLGPHFHILDVGCGPGTITVDFARFVPEGRVTGLERSQEVLESAKRHGEEKGVSNVEWVAGDVHQLPFEDNRFDVVYAHQVIQYVTSPVDALREMRRVLKPNGILALREGDFDSIVYHPSPIPELERWKELYLQIAYQNGGQPNAGRQVHAWAREAGFDPPKMKRSAGTWCYSSPEEIAWWSDLWAERVIKSSFKDSALKGGLATEQALQNISDSWKSWGEKPDAWFALLHGELLAWK
ncbi:methyltransferase type 11 [Meredithblackwellia eburnea MCA 4105]